MENKYCELCGCRTDHEENKCEICETKRINAAKFFNNLDFNQFDRATLKGVRHVLRTRGLSF